MTTTFQNRKLVLDELATLFTANGNWQEVYTFIPAVIESVGKTPLLFIRGRGTSQSMEGVFNNPTSYRIIITSYVLAYSEADNWSSEDAENELHRLDMVVRQVIRDNAGSGSTYDLLKFEDGYSRANDTIIEGVPYIMEERAIFADLNRGAV